MGIPLILAVFLAAAVAGPWPARGAAFGATGIVAFLGLAVLVEAARWLGLKRLLPRCPRPDCQRRDWGSPETVHGIQARRCAGCRQSLLYADDADLALELGTDGLPVGRHRLRWPWILGRWRRETTSRRPNRWFFPLSNRLLFAGLAIAEAAFVVAVVRMEAQPGIPWGALGLALVLSPFVAIGYFIAASAVLNFFLAGPMLRRHGHPFVEGDRVLVLSGSHEDRVLRVSGVVLQGLMLDLDGQNQFFPREAVFRLRFAGEEPTTEETMPRPRAPVSAPAEKPREGVRFSEDEVVFPAWNGGDAPALAATILLFVGFYCFMLSCLALTVRGLFARLDRESMFAFALVWAVFAPVVWPDVRSLRWRPRALIGALLDFLLLGRARLALRRVHESGKPILIMERRLPLGLVLREEKIALEALGPVTAFPMRIYAAGERLPLVVAFGNPDSKPRGLRLENEDAVRLVQTLRRWAGQARPNPALVRSRDVLPAGAALSAAAFSPDCRRLAVRGSDGVARIMRIESGQSLALSGGWVWSSGLEFSADGRLLADGESRVWNAREGGLAAELKEPCDVCHGRRDGTPQGHAWCVGSWRTLGGRMAQMYGELAVQFTGILASWIEGFGKEALSEGLRVRLVFSPTGRSMREAGAALSPDGSMAAAPGFNRLIWRWSLPGCQRLEPIENTGQRFPALAFSPDNRILASADRTLRLWDMQSGKALKTPEGRLARVSRAVFSADGRKIAAACRDGRAWLWDVSSGEIEARLEAARAPLLCAAISSDGSLVAAGAQDGEVFAWAASGHRVASLGGHGGAVMAVAFAPEAKTLLSAASDGEIRFWRM